MSARTLVLNALVAGAYLLAAQAGFSLAFATQQVTAVWPPTGIAVAALCIFGTRVTPAIFLAAFVANAILSDNLLTALGIAVGNMLGPLLSLYLLHRVGFDARMARVRDVLSLAVLAAGLAMTITATNGVLQLWWAGIVQPSAILSVWWTWWAGDAMGVLLLAPLFLTLATVKSTAPEHRSLIERAVAAAALAAAAWASFLGSVPLAYPVFPIVIWTALRFGQRETAAAVTSISAIAVWATVHGHGPFVGETLDQQLILLVTFMAVVAVTGLLLGAVTAERQTALHSLEQARQYLEQRVVERTQELSLVNRYLTTANETLSRRTTELANKNEEVEAFVYIVSHDLRAPLVNLQGFARELELGCDETMHTLKAALIPQATISQIEQSFDENIRTALRYIAASVNKFERLIGALLALSRTGQQSYEIETLDLKHLVAQTLDSLHQSITETGSEVTVEPLPMVEGDATAIGQVLGNLISNAVKYRHPDRPLRLAIRGSERDGKAEIRVADNGAGIPETAHRRLFQVFQRFHPHIASGDGIGLASVKRIIERHGGSIRAESAQGQGSTFIFTLCSAAPRTLS